MVITATDRLARTLQQEHDWQQREKGLHTWATPPIRPLEAWLSELWEEGMYSRPSAPSLRPLRAAEEQVIWEDILRFHAKDLPLDISATAELVRTSWRVLCDWHLPLKGEAWSTSEDASSFQKWVLEFRDRCRKNGWFSAAELSRHVSHMVQEEHVGIPGQIQIAGFLEPTPAQKYFFETLQNQGTEIHAMPAPSRAQKISCLRVIDPRREIRMAAEWARRILQDDPEAGNSLFRIGILIPGIANVRSQAERIFSEVLHPGTSLHPEKDAQRLFNISLGIPAGDYPIIQSALQIISIDPRKIPVEEAGRFLLSPFLPGFDQERSVRARIDVALRDSREPYTTLQDIIYQARKMGNAPVLASILRVWSVQFMELRGKKLPSIWAESFARLLQSGKLKIQSDDMNGAIEPTSIGWPGYWHHTSTEYQTYMIWEELMSGLVELDGVCGGISRRKAVSILRRMSASRIFQPKHEPAPVQILGISEAYGISFDYLWMLGMHDDAWPSPCRPVPFVPLTLQIQGKIWHCTPEGVLRHARALGDQLVKSAPVVIISHPEREGDVDRRESPLFADISKVSGNDLGVDSVQSLAERIQHSSKIERLQDQEGLPYDDERYGGGTYLFKLQAACPFRAFAELRLGATAPAFTESGLGAQDRGRLMHGILNIIWKKLGTQEALQALSEREEADLVQTIVHEELERFAKFRQALRNRKFFQIEQNRIRRMIAEWLALERQRAPFTVLEQEEKQRVAVGGINIDIREDRVDVLENGERVILDYKTGSASPKFWEGERPDDPQLPIYTVVAESPVAGLCFGSLRVGEVGFRGIADQKDIIPGVTPSAPPIETLIGQWRETLEHLGQEYKRGYAAVDPKDPTQTCRYCRLSTFCRVGNIPQNESPR